MSNILQAVLGFCGAAVYIGAIYMLCPEGPSGRGVKYVFSLIFLCVMASLIIPIQRLGKADGLDVTPADTSAVVSSVTEYQAEHICMAALSDAGIKTDKIWVKTDISEDGSIFISRITVCTSSDEDEVRRILTGVVEVAEVEVINE